MKCEDELSTNRMLVIPVNVAIDRRLSRDIKNSVDVMMDDVVNQAIKKRRITDRVITITIVDLYYKLDIFLTIKYSRTRPRYIYSGIDRYENNI